MEAYLDRILRQSHGPNAYLRRRHLLNKGQHMRCLMSETTRNDKFFLTQDSTYATSQMLNRKIHLIDLETVFKTLCPHNPGFVKGYIPLYALIMSGRLYPQMLNGGISGYFYFKCMDFYNKYALFYGRKHLNSVTIYRAPTMCWASWEAVILKIQKTKNFSKCGS